MFTGLVDHCGTVLGLEQQEKSARLLISTQFDGVAPGESIAVNGVCLTAVAPAAGQFFCDVSQETLRLTNLGALKISDNLNLERALLPTDRVGGHFVTGHVDATVRVTSMSPVEEYIEFEFEGVRPEHLGYLIPKGSVALNGVSLTVNELNDQGDQGFKVMLIPHTLERTQLGSLKVGSAVNVEYDMLAKITARQVALLLENEKVEL